jgi:Fur family iron response transcriptional regulator
MTNNMSVDQITGLLRNRGITPTAQRLEIAELLFSRCEHLSAEDVFQLVNAGGPRVSKATVYNTLGLFAEHGLIREVIADPTKVFFDPNTTPHHHFFDTSSGKLIDIPAEQVHIGALPEVPAGMQLEGVDVIVRVRRPGTV